MSRADRDTATRRKRALVTPEGVSLHLHVAGAGARAGAFAIDAILLILIVVTMVLLLSYAYSGGLSGGIAQIVLLLGMFGLRNLYFILFESGPRGATLGKRMVGIRVVARDGGRLTGSAVVARNLLREIEVLLPLTMIPVAMAEGAGTATALIGLAWTLLFLFFPLFNRDRLRAGDLIAGTWVVEARRAKIGIDLLDRAEAHGSVPVFTPRELAAYGQFELHKLEDVLRRDDEAAIELVAATIRGKLGRNDWGDDRAFLDAYYAALRSELERKLLFGKRKADKFDTAA